MPCILITTMLIVAHVPTLRLGTVLGSTPFILDIGGLFKFTGLS